jgi:hypothetical protein
MEIVNGRKIGAEVDTPQYAALPTMDNVVGWMLGTKLIRNNFRCCLSALSDTIQGSVEYRFPGLAAWSPGLTRHRGPND